MKAPQRAMRVPAVEPHIISPPRVADEGRSKQYKRRITTAFGMGPALVAALKRPDSAQSTAPSIAGSDISRHQEEVTIDINHLAVKHRSHDWSARAKVQDTLLQYIATATPNDFRSKTMNKATDILIAGLSDQHFKVVQSSLSGLYELLKLNDNISEDVLAQILPRVAVTVYSSQAKVKPGVLENGERVVALCKEKYRGEVLCGALSQALMQPELGKIPKMRIGCVDVKTMMIRLTPLTQEPDPSVQRNLRYVFQSMHEANPDTFWSALSGLKPGDKRVINMLFGKDIVADKSALIKIPKPMSPAPASPALSAVRVASPSSASPSRGAKNPMRPSPLKITPNRSSIIAKPSPKMRVVPPTLARRLSRSRSREGEEMRVDDLTLEEIDMSHVAEMETDEEMKASPPPSASDDWVSEADGRSAVSESHNSPWDGPIPPTAQDAMQLAALVTAAQEGGAEGQGQTFSPENEGDVDEDGSRRLSARMVQSNGSAIPVPSARTVSPRVDSLQATPRSSRRLGFTKREPLRLDDSEESTWSQSRGRRNSLSARRRRSIGSADGSRRGSGGDGQVPEEVLKGAAQEIDKKIEEKRRSYGTPMEVKETVTDFVDRVAEAVEKMVSQQQAKLATSPSGRGSPFPGQPLSVIDAVRMELANRVQATRIERERREERERRQEQTERNTRGLSWDSKVLSPDNLQEVLFAAAAEEESWGDAPGDTITPGELLTPSDVLLQPPTGMAAVVTVVKKKRRSLWENRANGIVDTILSGLQEKKDTPVVKNCLVLLKELVLNQFDLITDRTTDVFLGVLKCETYGGCSAEDFLEIALEIDSVLKAFEKSAPGPLLRAAIASALTENVGVRVSLEMLARVLSTPEWVNVVGDMGDEIDGEPEHEKEERKARQIHEAIIVEQIAKGLVSRKSAVRAAAFSAAVALVRRRGVAVSERLYEAVGREGGEARVFTVKEMVERRAKEE
ncbi:hypothetical protein HDV00_008174 [Rhizophlyctis rosea]|nr:hypothetical protein HDV00_008174 [Rhizophlyctis rosea]